MQVVELLLSFEGIEGWGVHSKEVGVGAAMSDVQYSLLLLPCPPLSLPPHHPPHRPLKRSLGMLESQPLTEAQSYTIHSCSS